MYMTYTARKEGGRHFFFQKVIKEEEEEEGGGRCRKLTCDVIVENSSLEHSQVEGGEKADPAETIYVDRKLLEDLGQWLGSLKEKV